MSRVLEAVRNVQTGAVRFPITCALCGSTCLTSERSEQRPFVERLSCLKCGRYTTFELAHTVRRQKIADYLRETTHPQPREAMRATHDQGGAREEGGHRGRHPR